ncbi:hypothetical protein P7C71_g4903, partial [Lecanoromycetidae sp. Uapishka_2]
PLTSFISSHPQFTTFVTGAFIYHNTRLLLVQRSKTDSLPSKWEVPGGGSETSDPTILHSLAREVFEETGLMLTRFVRQIGEGQEFQLGRRGWCLKLNFEIEVEEIPGGRQSGVHRHENEKERKDTVEIRLDPEEHQAYVWASRDDIWDGSYDIVSEDQKAVMLKAFDLRREESEALYRVDYGAQKGVELETGHISA